MISKSIQSQLTLGSKINIETSHFFSIHVEFLSKPNYKQATGLNFDNLREVSGNNHPRPMKWLRYGKFLICNLFSPVHLQSVVAISWSIRKCVAGCRGSGRCMIWNSYCQPTVWSETKIENENPLCLIFLLGTMKKN